MVVEVMGGRQPSSEVFSHFVIKLPQEHGVQYAICERLVIVDAAGGGIFAPGLLDAMFAGQALRALPLPTIGGRAAERFGTLLARAQSGDNRPSLTIKNYVRSDDHDNTKS